MRWLCLVALLTGCERILGLAPVAAARDGAVTGPDAGQDADGGGVHGDAMADAPPDVGAVCPYQLVQLSIGGSGYYRAYTTSGDRTTWAAAERRCELDQIAGSTMFTHLVVFATDQEIQGVQATLIGVTGAASYAWAGLSRPATTGTFEWITNEDTAGYPTDGQDPWASGYPQSGAGIDCVQFDSQAQLTNVSCFSTLKFVCECDAHPPNPLPM